MGQPPLLKFHRTKKNLLREMRSIAKCFPGVLALSEVNFEVGQYEAVALDVIRRSEIK